MAEPFLFIFDARKNKDVPVKRGTLTREYIEIDAVVSERLTYEAELTTSPVELGNADVVDHKRPRPRVLEIQGIIPESPVEIVSEQFTGGIQGKINKALSNFSFLHTPLPYQFYVTEPTTNRAQEAYQTLQELFKAKQTLRILTQREVLDDFVLTNLTFAKSDAGLYLGFSAVATELRIARTGVANVAAEVKPKVFKKVKVYSPAVEIPKTEEPQRLRDFLLSNDGDR